MPANGTDLVMVERGGVLHKAPASEIAALAGGAAHYIDPSLGAGSFVTAQVNALAQTTTAGAANRIDFVRFVPSRTITVDLLSIEVTAFVAGAQARVGIYGNTAGNLPGDLLSGAGSLLDCGTANTTRQSTIAGGLTLTGGTPYWLALHTSSTATLRALANGGMMPLGIPESGTSANVARRATATFASGLPTTAPSTTLVSTNVPRVALRLA